MTIDDIENAFYGVLETVVIIGLSGAGCNTAAKCFEDFGYFVVDNLPPELISTFVDLGSRSQGAIIKLAVVMDVCSRGFSSDLRGAIKGLAVWGMCLCVLFFEVNDEVLVRRFESVRRAHLLQGDGRLVDGIEAECALVLGICDEADLVIDISECMVHELRRAIESAFVDGTFDGRPELRAIVVFFGFKYGLPLDADLVVDVRFLLNLYWILELCEFIGKIEEVCDYVMG